MECAELRAKYTGTVNMANHCAASLIPTTTYCTLTDRQMAVLTRRYYYRGGNTMAAIVRAMRLAACLLVLIACYAGTATAATPEEPQCPNTPNATLSPNCTKEI